MSPIGATPPSSNTTQPPLFFPPSQPTPDHIMLAARKQQLAHLQNLQRQQQQMLQQMTPRSHAMSHPSFSAGFEERNDRFTSGVMRSPAMSYKSNATATNRFQGTPQASYECDYDTNPTELYLAVQKKDWTACASIATEFPAEASTWVSRKESDGKLRWRLLPLHAAIIFKAPESAVQALLQAFQHGAACKDDQGMLPLHLAFRNGCDVAVVNLLLMAYPQSVDVQDRKGRTPMVLAQTSNHTNKEAYVRALERGPAYYAVASAAQNSADAQARGVPMTEEERNNIEALRMKVDQMTVEHTEKVTELEAELTKTQETSQVLVDHVNSLEAQLASRSDTERFLATKIANLDSQLKSTAKSLEEKEAEFAAATEEKETKHAELQAKIDEATKENEELKLALTDKQVADQKVYALTNKERISYEERMEKCEREAAIYRSDAQMLEEQLKKKIETEHALASQVSMLAAQLASSASNTTETTESYHRKCEALEKENSDLKQHILSLEKKLNTVASALDAMATEQERIVTAATRHEETMADASAAHLKIMNDTARQESLLEDAAREREQIVAILMRQAEDAERTITDREAILEAVREQEGVMMAAAEERDLVVASVNKQKEYMDFVMNGELNFLKMTKSEEEQEETVEQRRIEMEAKKEEFLSKSYTQGDADEDEDVAGVEADEEIMEAKSKEIPPSPSQREAELRAQIAIEEAMLAKLKADEAEAESEVEVANAEIAIEEAMLATLCAEEAEAEEEEPVEAEDEEPVEEEEQVEGEEEVQVVAEEEEQVAEDIPEDEVDEVQEECQVEEAEAESTAGLFCGSGLGACGAPDETDLALEQPTKKPSRDPEETTSPGEVVIAEDDSDNWIAIGAKSSGSPRADASVASRKSVDP